MGNFHFVMIGILLLASLSVMAGAHAQKYPQTMEDTSSDYAHIMASPFWAVEPPYPYKNDPIFTVTSVSIVDGNVKPLSLALDPSLKNFYQDVGLYGQKNPRTVFVYPIFTQAAYGQDGFYQYYKKKCDTRCLTVSIPTKIEGEYTSSIGAALVLSLLDYPHITDIDIDKNPGILKKYDRVILLHNEYVTGKEFQAITSHPNVVYLYPNALYAEVNSNYDTNTITLVRGHGFPSANIGNGFDWKYDDTTFEHDDKCTNWKFYDIDNGMMLNCYPDNAIIYDGSILRAVHEGDAADLKDDAGEWLGNSTERISNQELLGDAGVQGHSVPPWFSKTAQWFSDGQISEKDFKHEILYLRGQNVIQ